MKKAGRANSIITSKAILTLSDVRIVLMRACVMAIQEDHGYARQPRSPWVQTLVLGIRRNALPQQTAQGRGRRSDAEGRSPSVGGGMRKGNIRNKACLDRRFRGGVDADRVRVDGQVLRLEVQQELADRTVNGRSSDRGRGRGGTSVATCAGHPASFLAGR